MTLAGIPYYTFAWNNVDWSAVLIVCFARDSLVSLGAVYSSKGASTVVFHRRTPYSIHVSRGTRQVAFNPMTSYREIIKLSKSLCHHTAPCLNGETWRRGISAIMFLEFQVRVINILTFQKTVLCPGDRQRVAARSVHKGTPIFCHCRHFYFALFRALSLAGDPWFTFAASLLSCVAIGLMDECAPATVTARPVHKGTPFCCCCGHFYIDPFSGLVPGW